MQTFVRLLLVFIAFIFPVFSLADNNTNIPILVYHNFNPTKPGSMNLTPQKFESQIQWLKQNGFNIIPLQQVVEYLQGSRDSLPPKAIAITVDDGWQSQYTYVVPLAKKYNFPVTFFLYPETISVGKNSMTWDELHELQKNSLFDFQGHTYSHPNFKIAKRKLSADAYAKFVSNELGNSKKILEEKLNKKITLLAWPFGIYNDELEQAAANAGYIMAFTIDYRTANKSFKPMAQPRYMIVDSESVPTFQGIAKGANSKKI